MSELQVALIGAGVAAVGLVWGYNLWQDRKHRQAAERIFRNESGDALGVAAAQPAEPAERREPVADAASDAEFVSGAAIPGADVPGVGVDASPGAELPPVDGTAADALPTELADPVADCVARFEVADGLAAPAVWAMQGGWAGAIGKPLRWLARDDDGRWRPVEAHDPGHFVAWATVLQLVDRRGAVSDGELGRFCDGMQALAQQAGAALTLPGRAEALIRATRLDEFCAGVDIQFVLHVVEAGGGMLAGPRLRAALEAAGLALEDDGMFRARDAEGGERFAVGNLGNEAFDAAALESLATLGLTLRLDVPRVAEGVASFDAMLAVARDLATALGGVVVDAQRAPLAEAMIVAIRARTAELQQRLREAGIVPGSALAQRLFA